MKKSIQRILFITLTLAVFFTAAPHMNFSAKAAVKESYLTADEAVEWLNASVGVKRGDGHCIAFIKDYYQALTGYIPSGNACDYAHNTLPEGFGWTRVKGERNLQKGDIMVWTHGTRGMGHAGIYGGESNYYHQKWSGMYVEIIGKAYLDGFSIRRSGSFARYWGVIRPNFRSESMFEEMDDVNYKISNAYSGKYLTAKNGSEITTAKLKSPASKAQIFTFDKSKVGYNISPLSSSKGIGADFEEGKALSGVAAYLYKEIDNDSCRWRFEKTGSSYVIRNVYNPSLCLTADKQSGKLSVKTYVGAKNQKWNLETDITLSYSAKGGWNVPEKVMADKGETCTVSKQKPYRLGCKFLGWATENNAKVPEYLPGESITIKKSTTLYAVWEKNKEYKIKKIKLSKKEYTYNGKVKTPTVTVTDTNGNLLREGKDYTLTYSKGRKNVGKYKVTVTYMGKFSGKEKLYFTVIPQSTKITGLSAKTDRITVRFKKQNKKTNGYLIQYSTSPDFTEETTKTLFVDSSVKTSATVKKLKSGTKWYVRVSAVKKTDKNIYQSVWSDVKSIKTKKKA